MYVVVRVNMIVIFFLRNALNLLSIVQDWKRSIRHNGKSIKLLINKGILTVHSPLCDCAYGSGIEPFVEKYSTASSSPPTIASPTTSLVKKQIVYFFFVIILLINHLTQINCTQQTIGIHTVLDNNCTLLCFYYCIAVPMFQNGLFGSQRSTQVGFLSLLEIFHIHNN